MLIPTSSRTLVLPPPLTPPPPPLGPVGSWEYSRLYWMGGGRVMAGVTGARWQTETLVNWNGEPRPLPALKVSLARHGCIRLPLICSAGVNPPPRVLLYLTGGSGDGQTCDLLLGCTPPASQHRTPSVPTHTHTQIILSLFTSLLCAIAPLHKDKLT